VVDGLPTSATTRADPTLLKALARAFRYQRMLDDGRYASISEMAAAEKLDRGYLGRLLQLTLLAPDVVEAILGGRALESGSLPALMGPFPVCWSKQRATVGLSLISRPPAPAEAGLHSSCSVADTAQDGCSGLAGRSMS
jgi:hypothetical protein